MWVSRSKKTPMLIGRLGSSKKVESHTFSVPFATAEFHLKRSIPTLTDHTTKKIQNFVEETPPKAAATPVIHSKRRRRDSLAEARACAHAPIEDEYAAQRRREEGEPMRVEEYW